MATTKGQDFMGKYKNKGVNKDTWLIMYRKGHIDLEELADCIELTDEEIEQLEKEQIDICPPKTLEERVEELEQENTLLKQEKNLLKQENKLLHTQVEANASNNEFLESCMMEMAQVVYA